MCDAYAPNKASNAVIRPVSPLVPLIALDVDGVTVRIGQRADMATVAAVIRAVKAIT